PVSNAPGNELWRSDGTAEGTILLRPTLCTRSISDSLDNFTEVSGTLFFTALSVDNQHQIWRSDGTRAGTTLVSDIRPIHSNSYWSRSSLFDVNGTLFFSATRPDIGAELWCIAPPTAIPTGPCVVGSGRTISLDASKSFDPDPAESLAYAWDLDGDGLFGEIGPNAGRGDETGPQPVFSAAGLFAGTYPIMLRVTNSAGLSSTASTTVTVLAPSLVGTPADDSFTLRLSADGSELEGFVNASPDAEPAFRLPVSQVFGPLSLAGNGGHDTLTLDCSNGNPLERIALAIENGAITLDSETKAIRMLDLTLAAGATLEIGEQTLILPPAAHTPLPAQVTSARADRFKALAIVHNNDGNDSPLIPQIDGLPLQLNDTLIRCSWAGDVNLDGKVDLADYFHIDAGFITQKSGYANGDLNYDGKINLADYFLVDSAFISQNAVLSGTRAPTPTAFPPSDSLRQAAPSEPAPLAVQSTQVCELCLTQASWASNATGLFATRPIASDRRLATGRLFAGVFAEPTQLFELPG
ncbi:MAG TPA: dockerin type I domain-containing protein, partial [Tepidisphaeraceae bacterium]|nr:dockerin type I domain-containing protein [Tepidisphaeraceae bacterium]